MAITNTWLTPLQRSYQTIKNQVIEKMETKVPEITDKSEGNIFIIIISIFSAIAEVLHYYIDNTARESFLVSARRLSSVVKHAKLVDYHINAAHPASTDLILSRSGDNPISTNLLIPINTQFISNDGKKWLSTKAVNWRTGTYSVTIPVSQKEPSETGITLGTVLDPDGVIELNKIPSNKQYVEGSMSLTINNVLWSLVNTFAYSKPTDKVYKVELDDEFEPVIVFGDGKFGMKPTTGQQVKVSYYLTQGAEGNIDANSFETVPSSIKNVVQDATISNSISAAGGTDYEDFDTIKEHIPLSIKTLGVAITKEDWEALVRLVPGVNKSYVNYICGRFVEVYITPTNGTEASSGLIDEVAATLSKSKVITTSISVKSTKASYVVLHATVTGKKSFSKSDIENQVRRALISTYNENYSEINQPVRLSDLYSLVDGQSTVDYLTIDKLFFKPLVYPIEAGLPILNIAHYEQKTFQADSIETNAEKITIEILNSTQFKVALFNGTEQVYTFNNNVNIQTVYSSFDINISKQGVTYNTGDRYILVIQRMGQDLTPYDFTIPVITTENLNLKINEKV